MLILYFHVFETDFEVLNGIFQAFLNVATCYCELQYVPVPQKFLTFY